MWLPQHRGLRAAHARRAAECIVRWVYGYSIWVANQNSNNVTKLRASDGATIGTFTVSSLPSGLAFDGANICVANRGLELTHLQAVPAAEIP